MNFNLEQLLNYLTVTPTSGDSFLGDNLPGKRRAVFGGQVIAQALSAAMQCVEPDRRAHSLHGHFLRPGDIKIPVSYHVIRVRDGGSFSLRQVSAMQGEKTIFLATVSFQKSEAGLQHQQPAPPFVPRTEMISEFEFWEHVHQERPELHYLRPDNFTALDILSRFRPGVNNPQPQQPAQSFWFRANGEIKRATDHQLILAFQSDLLFLNTALHAHPHTLIHPDVQAASLDHCLWFYGEPDTTQWLYYDMQSPVAAGGRGLNHGYFYTESGTLVAASSQEGLMRVRQ